jgi:predicted peroxiredoxin
MKKVLASLLFIFIFGMGTANTASADFSQVFTNVTTADVNKAAMAIKFTHSIMKEKGLKATLFFNVYGVALIDKTKPSPIYATGDSIAVMLDQFMKDGGTVIGCPMCMKNVGGMTKDNLLPGVTAAPGMGLAAVTMPNTLVLSY